MNRFDVSVHAIRRRAGRRRPFEVRWRAAGRSRSKSFITRGLADSYRAELVRAARTGLEFNLWVPRTSSTSCDQAVFVDHAADARVSSDTVLLKIDRFG